MKVKKYLKRLYYFVKPKSEKYKKTKLCGVPLNLLDRTLRPNEDQDDTWFFYLAKHHNIIYDIGCNIGYTALLALVQNPNRQIIMVDPNPEALQKAATNIIFNNIGAKAHYFTGFVSDKVDDTVKFYTVGAGAAGSMHASHAKTAASVNSFLEVKTITLDYLYSFYDIKPDLIKIDIEGAETLAMKGALDVARLTQCTFFIEMHAVENISMQDAAQIMLNWCQEVNYKAWYLKTGQELKTAETLKSRGKCHLLLLPDQKLYPEYLKDISERSKLPSNIH